MASSRSLGSLTLDLILKMGGFEQGMDKAARTTDKRMREMEKRAYEFGRNIGKGLRVASSVIAAVSGIRATALIALTKAAIDNADAMRDLSIQTGVSTETLSAYGYAAKQTGTDIDQLGKGLVLLSKNATAALDPKSRQAGLFKALLGDDYKKDLGDIETLVPKIADAFADMEDGPTKAALALQLFGRSGAELIEFLNSGGDGLDDFKRRAQELGIEISQNTADAADEFNDKLADLKAAAGGLGLQVAEQLLPKLIQLVDIVADFAQEGGNAEKIADVIASSFEFAARAGVALYSVFEQIKLRMDDIVLAAGEMSPGAGIRSLLEGGDYMKPYEDLRKQRIEIAGKLEESNKRLLGAVNGASDNEAMPELTLPGISVTGTAAQIEKAEADFKKIQGFLENPTGRTAKTSKSGKSDAEREAEQIIKSYESLNERLAETQALFGKTGEAAKVRYQVETDDLSKLDEKTREYVQTLQAQAISGAELIDQMELMEELDDAALKRVEQESEAFAERMKSNKELIEDMESELKLLGMTNEERERSIALSYLSKDATDQQKEAVSELADKLRNAAEAEENWNQLQDNISNGLYDIISGAESAGDAIKNFLDDLNAQILKNITDDWAESLTDWFKNFASGSAGGSGGGGIWSSILGAFGFGGGMAGGGTARPYSATRINEVGFEMATINGNDYLLTGSQPVNVTSSNRVDTGRTTVVNMTVQGRIDKRSEERIAREFSQRQRVAMVGA